MARGDDLFNDFDEDRQDSGDSGADSRNRSGDGKIGTARRVSNFVFQHKFGATVVALAVCAGAAGAGVWMSADTRRPLGTSESNEMFDARLFDKTVVFYQQVCPALDVLQDGPDVLSQAAEQAMDSDSPATQATVQLSAVADLADRVSDAADTVAGIYTPEDIPSKLTGQPVDYVSPRDDIAATLRSAGESLRTAVDANPADDVEDGESLSRFSRSISDAVGEASSSVSEAQEELVGDISAPNKKTWTAVTATPECADRFAGSKVDPDEVHEPSVQLWTVFGKSSGLFSEAMTVFSDQDALDAVMTEGSLADKVEALAESADEAASLYRAWLDKFGDDPVSGNLDAARDGVDVYTQVAAMIREVGGEAAAADPQSVMDRIKEASVVEGKFRIRSHREAKAPNTPTLEVIQKADTNDSQERVDPVD